MLTFLIEIHHLEGTDKMSNNKLEIKTDEAVRIFKLLEDMNDLFHQPMKYKNAEVVEQFSLENYDEIKDLYYNVVWNWLPLEIRNKIENE